MIKKLWDKITGVDRIEKLTADALDQAERATKIAAAAVAEAEAAKELERVAKLSPKERATEKKEPWVAVLDTHVNMDNLRNGFLELDWNEYFVLQLRTGGYTGENDEAVVDQWFSELCRNLGNEEGVNMDRRGSGYVNRALRDDGLTEIS